MKRKLMVFLSMFFAVTLSVGIMAACKENEEPPAIVEGPETGVYYYDAEGSEYTISLHDGNKIDLSVRDLKVSGTYTIGEDANFSLNFGETTLPVSASYADEVITLTYENASMRFLRKIDYTVSFDAAGGSTVESATVLNGKTVSKPEDPTRSGYEFVGWYEDTLFTKPFAFGTQIVGSDLTLHAQWAELIPGQEEFSIAFDLNYADAPASPASIPTIGGKLYGVTYPTRSGHTFAGWGVSMYEDPARLTTVWTPDMKFAESTTLYAIWVENGSAGKLASPVVSVSADRIGWEPVSGAGSYSVDIIAPDGTNLTDGRTESSASFAFDFGNYAPGDYVIKVTAKGSGVTDSEPTVRYFKNKALARVSRFNVVEPGTLLFNGVEHAQHYYITVDCGNPSHNHTMYDNNNSTNFNFTNCAMQPGGIKFKITATADGYASSESREFVYNRLLGGVEGFYLDEKTQTLTWDAVKDATDYVVTVHCENPLHVHEPVEVATNKYDLKECAGEIAVSVYPKTKGYNSPAAESYTYQKTVLATPGDFRIVGSVLSWTEVAGAASYSVKIDGKEFTARENHLDLSSLSGITWIAVEDYRLSVCAVGTDYTQNSVWSDEFDVRYAALYGTMSYSANRLTWRRVVGAEFYEVRVNEGEIKEIDGGLNYADIVLTQPGVNHLSVRYFDGDLYSDWVRLDVVAHTVSFDARSGEGRDSLYVAVGDELVLPDTTRTGYTFSGWYNAPGGAQGNAAQFNDKKFTGSGDVILYADWTALKYHVNYDFGDYSAGGGLTGGDVTYGSNFALDVPVTQDGSVAFAGWYSMPNGGGKQYTDETGKSVLPWDVAEDNVTLYAYWAQAFEYLLQNNNTYSVTKGPGISLLKEVTIPKEHTDPSTSLTAAVTYIEGNAFYNVTTLVKISFYNTVTGIGVGAFKGCSALESINVLDGGNQEAVYRSSDGVLIHSTTSEETQTGQTSIEIYPAAKQGEYTIPSYVNTIPTEAFAKTLITSVRIPASVTSIGLRAFSSCGRLQSVIFDTVGPVTDEDEPDATRVLPVVLSKSAFEKCNALTYINIPARAMFADGADFDSVLTGCTSLTELHIEESHPDYALVDGMVTDKEMSTILYCPKGRSGVIDFNSSLDENYVKIRKIGGNAFMRCTKITEVYFPSYLQEIEDGKTSSSAFYGCSSLTKVVFAGPSGSGLRIGNYSFQSLTKLKSVVFEEGSKVSQIGVWAFYGCTGLTEFTIPATVEKIEQGAFMGCTNLETLTFGALDDTVGAAESLTFGNQVFQRCAKLKEVRLPANLEDFPSNAFTGCTSLEHIYVSPDNEHLKDEDGVLYNKDLTKIMFYPYGLQGDYELPDSVVEIQASVFDERKGLTGISIGPNVTTIGNNAFEDCTNLTKVVFRSTLKDGSPVEEKELTIGSRAFSNTAADISLPSRTVSIGNYAFEGSAITSVTIPAGITSLGTNLFDSCTYLTNVTLESGVKEISESMFTQSGITEIFIPNTVTKIGRSAFGMCNFLRKITFESGGTEPLAIGTDPLSGGSVFTSTPIEEFTFPARTNFLGSHLFTYCGLLKKVTFEEGCKVESFGTNFFLDCKSLEEVFIPKTVTKIYSGAFSGLTSLKKITFEPGGTEPLIIDYNENMQTHKESTNNFGFLGAGLHGDAPNKLEKVEFPARLVKLGLYDFSAGSASYADNKYAKIESVSFAERTTDAEKALDPLTIGNDFGKYATIGNITLPSYLSTIGNYFMRGASGVTQLEVPEGVTEIGTYFFNDCTALQSLTTPASLAKIGTNFLDGCSGLTTLTLKGKFEVGSGFLSECTSLETINVTEDTPIKIQDGILYLLNDDKEPEKLMFVLNSVEETVHIPNTVTEVNAGAFYKNTVVKHVIFDPDGTAELTIGGTGSTTSAFGYSVIESIVLPARLGAIPNYLFYHCEQLTSVTFGEGEDKLTSIGNYAFQYTALQSIVIPDSVTTFSGSSYSNSVFGHCEALESVTLPAKLNKSFNVLYLFAYCTGLKEVKIAEDAENFSTKDGVLFDKSGEKLLMYPAGKTEKEYTIPEGTKTIGANAFSLRTSAPSTSGAGTGTGNTYLNQLTVASTVTSIENYAFCDMPNLLTIEFVGGGQAALRIPGNAVFANNASLFMVTLPTRLVENSSTAGSGTYMFAYTPHLSRVVFENDKVNAKILFGQYAFLASGITNFTVPDGVQTFAVPATSTTSTYFFRDSMIETVTLSSQFTTINRYAFSDTDHLQTVDTAKATKLDSIGQNAFYGSAITAFNVPASVTKIDNSAFYSASLTNFVLPATVTTVGTGVFYGCKQLVSISLPENMKEIPTNFFSGSSSLTSVRLPSNITSIGNYAFNGSAITSIDIPASVKTIGTNAFINCKGLTEIKLPDALTSIGENAFKGCENLVSVELPDNLQTIGNSAFQDTAITSFVIPASLTSIGNNAFNGCTTLKELTFEPNGTNELNIGQSAFAGTGITFLSIPNRVTVIQSKAFQNATALETVVFENGSKPLDFNNGTAASTVGKGTSIFDGCVALTSVSFNNRVTYIADNMFSGCTELKEIIIPSTVTKIGANAFMGDTSLTTVNLESGLEDIGANAFDGDSMLENIEIPDTVTNIGENAFNGVKNFKVSASSSSYTMYQGILFDFGQTTVLYVPTNLTGTVTLPETVFELGKGAFANSKVTEVVLPEYLTAIPDEAFKGSAIQKITFGSALISIGASAFEDCKALTTVDFGNCELATIGDNAFKNCSALTSLALPETLTSIGASAFVGSALTTFNIGEQLTSIGANAFDGVSTLTSVTYTAGGRARLTIGEYAFANSGLVSIALPARIRCYVVQVSTTTYEAHIAVGNYAFYNCAELTSVTFEKPEEPLQGYLTFGDYAFAKCSALKEIEFPDYLGNLIYAPGGYILETIPALGAHAFEDCVLLTEVTFKANDAGSIVFGESLFKGCVMLNTVNLPENVTEISAGMFENSGISTLVLPASVKAIGARAFAGCKQLTTLTIPAAVEVVGAEVFEGWTETQSVLVVGKTENALPPDWDANWKGTGTPAVTWNVAE